METQDADGDLELPRGIALAWGVAANPQRGPKRELSIERIVESAAEIADEGGLSSVSMTAVAARLGFTTMSLYRYVSAKDDLVLLLAEYGLGLPPASIAASGDWRDGLRLWYCSVIEVYLARPWLLDIPVFGNRNTPNNLAWLDSALAVLSATTLSPFDRLATALVLSGQARWQAAIARSSVDGSTTGGLSAAEAERVDNHVFGSLVTPELFPALTDAVRGGAFAVPDFDPWGFGLERMLDGLDVHMGRSAPGATPAAPPVAGPTDLHPRDHAVRDARQRRREAESALREAVKREREAVAKAFESEQKAAERAAKKRG